MSAFPTFRRIADLGVSKLTGAAMKPIQAPFNLLFGSKGRGLFRHTRFRPRAMSSWKPISEAEFNVMKMQGRPVTLINGKPFAQARSFGGVAGVAQRHPLGAALVGGGGYLLLKTPPMQKEENNYYYQEPPQELVPRMQPLPANFRL